MVSVTAPFTYALEDDILDETERLLAKLKEAGVDMARVGQELEFFFFEPLDTPFSIDFRSQCLAELDARIGSAGAAEREILAKKRDELSRFNGPEMLMYHLIERDPLTRDILEYAFGQGTSGHGYYDNPGMLEARLKHVPADEISYNYSVFAESFIALCHALNLTHFSGFSHHISHSLWVGDDNLMSAYSPRHMTAGKHAAEGICRVLADASYAIADSENEFQHLHLGVKRARAHPLRLAKDRFEVRLPTNDRSQHPDAVIMLVLAGAWYGLKAHAENRADALIPAVDTRHVVYRQNGKEHTHILHMFTENTVNERGVLQLNRSYVCYALADICAEIDWITKNSPEYEALSEAASQAFYKDQSSPLYEQWYTKLINALKKCLTPEDFRFTGELEHLAPYIEPTGIIQSFTINPIYPLRDTGHWLPDTAMVARMQESPVIREALSPRFREKFLTAAIRRFGAPEGGDIAYTQKLNSVLSRRAHLAASGDVLKR